MHFSDVEVGKQLIVGNGTYYDTLGLGENVIRDLHILKVLS